jgi:hypothetical protein
MKTEEANNGLYPAVDECTKLDLSVQTNTRSREEYNV